MALTADTDGAWRGEDGFTSYLGIGIKPWWPTIAGIGVASRETYLLGRGAFPSRGLIEHTDNADRQFAVTAASARRSSAQI